MDITTEEQHVTALVAARYPDVPPDRIQQLVDAAFATYDDASVQGFIPILVQRAVERQLRDAAGPPRARAESA
ncbi:MAG TPA: hypothetical protein VMT69_14450 [Kineosporiaceae bacterium]|nr:hypothetical protein [Kineosporiaceae bacterium]